MTLIPCSKRMPKLGKNVLWQFKGYHCDSFEIGRLVKNGTEIEIDWYYNKPISDAVAWMPLPKLHKPKQKK